MQDTLRMRHLKHLHVDAHVFMQACVLCARAVSVYPHVCTCVCVCVCVCVCMHICRTPSALWDQDVKGQRVTTREEEHPPAWYALYVPYMCPTRVPSVHALCLMPYVYYQRDCLLYIP